MSKDLLEEKLAWEVDSGEFYKEAEPEHEYDPEERMDALEVLLASIDATVRLVDRYAKGSPEEKDVATEAGELKRNLEEYSRMFQELYRQAEQDYIDDGRA